MLTWLARRLLKDAWIVVAVWAALAAVLMVLALTGLGGKGLFDRLETDAATIGGTQSAQGEEIISTLTGDAQTVSLLVTGVDISQATTQQAVATALEPVHKELGSLVGQTNVLDPFVVEARLAQVPGELRSVSATAQGIVSDDHLMSAAVSQQVESDLVRGEMIALPVTLVVMVLVFGGFLAAGMPILGALSSIAGSFGVLWIASTLVDLQSFVVNIVTVIGLGLSIDYALLITSRYREELAQPAQVPQESAGAGQARRNRRRSRRSGPVAQALTTAMRTTAIEATAIERRTSWCWRESDWLGPHRWDDCRCWGPCSATLATSPARRASSHAWRVRSTGCPGSCWEPASSSWSPWRCRCAARTCSPPPPSCCPAPRPSAPTSRSCRRTIPPPSSRTPPSSSPRPGRR